MANEPRLPLDAGPSAMETLMARDESARAFAVDPSRNVVLEASAGTGKTHVLVTRYINLLRAGVDPANILAITFTRKAAAEMRDRIVRDLRTGARLSAADEARWTALRDRLGDISISTIDAFCFALLREFPLEADLDPGFAIADETVTARLADQAIDGALGAARRMASSEDVALLMAVLGERPVRSGLAALVGRRLAAGPAIRRFLAGAAGLSPRDALARVVARLQDALASLGGGLEGFIADGPLANDAYGLVEADLRAAAAGFEAERAGGAAQPDRGQIARAVVNRVSRYFLNDEDEPRARPAQRYSKKQCRDAAAWTRHSRALRSAAPLVADAVAEFDRSLNVALVRAMGRLFRIARWRYRQALDAQALVDFPEGLSRTLRLLRRMDEFAQSRYRLEARYHHVLVDEFQDTNPSQWILVARLIESWGEGMGLAHEGPLQPSIFIVGDRKQSIYAFRDADVRMLGRAHRHVSGLRPGGEVRVSIVAQLQGRAGTAGVHQRPVLVDRLVGETRRRLQRSPTRPTDSPWTPRRRATAGCGWWPGRHGLGRGPIIAAEMARLLADGTVRDRDTGVARRTCAGRHRHPVPVARQPPRDSNGAGGARDTHVRLQGPWVLRRRRGQGRDRAGRLPGPAVVAARCRRAGAIAPGPRVGSGGQAARPAPRGRAVAVPAAACRLDDEDRRVLSGEGSLGRWLPRCDRVPPAELLDRVSRTRPTRSRSAALGSRRRART